MNMNTETTKIVPIGWLELIGEINSPLPLESTRIKARVTGSLAQITVEQQFRNPLKEPAEIAYLFPLSDKALLTGFELHAGNRVIRGDLQEMKKARQVYEDARSEGKQTALLESRDPSLFSIQIANIRPDEALQSVITFQDVLNFRDGEYEFVFPMGITPKYHSPEHPTEGDGVDAPVALPGERISKVEISLSVDPGTAVIDAPTSPTHKIRVQPVGKNNFEIELEEPTLPDHDFVVRWRVSRDQAVLNGWYTSAEGSDIFYALVQPPALDALPADPQPREFIFVLDRSGSMSGEPIAQARNALRACLRSLNPQDIFYILLFDDRLEWFQREPSLVSQQSIETADRYLDKVQGRGGTEIVKALQEALNIPTDEKRSRYLIFLTDGAVSVQQRAFDEVRRGIGKARLFTFGIGPSVNRGLLNRLAKYGRGASDFLQLDEDIEEAILRFQDRISFPALENLSLQWKNIKTWDVLPDPLPDLYAGQPLQIAGRLGRSKSESIDFSLKATQNGNPIQIECELVQVAGDSEDMVRRAWAHARMEDLLDQLAMNPENEHKIRTEIINLSLSYQLACPYTAFVAVDEDITVKGGKPTLIRVSQPLPKDLSASGFNGTPVSPPGLAFVTASAAPVPGPSLLRRIAPRGLKTSAPMSSKEIEEEMDLTAEITPQERVIGKVDTAGDTNNAEDYLRQLARSQNVDGSWDGNVELTAAALLCFVRLGQTTHTGYYRKLLKKAVDWLEKAVARGTTGFVKAAALAEMAQAVNRPEIKQTAQNALAGLPEPTTPLEEYVIRRWVKMENPIAPQKIETPDELRWAALSNTQLPIPANLLRGKIERTWQVALKATAIR